MVMDDSYRTSGTTIDCLLLHSVPRVLEQCPRVSHVDCTAMETSLVDTRADKVLCLLILRYTWDKIVASGHSSTDTQEPARTGRPPFLTLFRQPIWTNQLARLPCPFRFTICFLIGCHWLFPTQCVLAPFRR